MPPDRRRPADRRRARDTSTSRWQYPDGLDGRELRAGRARSSSAAATTSTWSPRSAARRARRPATWSSPRARSRSTGPWEHCPHNPIVRTGQRRRALVVARPRAPWSKDPAGNWWMVYHGYENGFHTLGRQTLLEPIEWTADGWFRAKGGDLSQPIAKPAGGEAGPAGFALSDDFSTDKFGLQWAFHNPAADEMNRVRRETRRDRDRGQREHAARLLAARLHRRRSGLRGNRDARHSRWRRRRAAAVLQRARLLRLRLQPERDAHLHLRRGAALDARADEVRRPCSSASATTATIVTWSYSHDGGASWTQHPWQMEVSGLHHNVFGGFLSLKPAVYSAGEGSVRLRGLTYRALPSDRPRERECSQCSQWPWHRPRRHFQPRMVRMVAVTMSRFRRTREHHAPSLRRKNRTRNARPRATCCGT